MRAVVDSGAALVGDIGSAPAGDMGAASRNF